MATVLKGRFSFSQKGILLRKGMVAFQFTASLLLIAVPGKEVGKFLANRPYGASASEERAYEMLKADHAFITAYGLQLVAGRAFDKSRPADSTGIVLNESAVKQLVLLLPNRPLDKRYGFKPLQNIRMKSSVLLKIIITGRYNSNTHLLFCLWIPLWTGFLQTLFL